MKKIITAVKNTKTIKFSSTISYYQNGGPGSIASITQQDKAKINFNAKTNLMEIKAATKLGPYSTTLKIVLPVSSNGATGTYTVFKDATSVIRVEKYNCSFSR